MAETELPMDGAQVVLFADAGEHIGRLFRCAEELQIRHVMHNNRLYFAGRDDEGALKWRQVAPYAE